MMRGFILSAVVSVLNNYIRFRPVKAVVVVGLSSHRAVDGALRAAFAVSARRAMTRACGRRVCVAACLGAHLALQRRRK